MTTRSRARWGQLALFAALLFGIVTMHTLGHPSGHGSGTGMGTGTGVTTGSAHFAYAPYAVSGPSALSAAPEAHKAAPPTAAVVADTKMPPMSGMDPLSVCLAVLGGFALVLLLAVALGRPWAGALRPPALTRLPHALWPNAPPPRTLLARLSVLRI